MHIPYQTTLEIQKVVALTSREKATTAFLLRELFSIQDATPDAINRLANTIVRANLFLRDIGMRIKFAPKPEPGLWFLSIKNARHLNMTDPQTKLLIIVFTLAYENEDGLTSIEDVETIASRGGRTRKLIDNDLRKLIELGYVKKNKKGLVQLTPQFFAEVDVPALVESLTETQS